MIGQTLGHYRIVEKIGEGGMGVVYRAHDERLDRDVALKVLPKGTLADESARKRFRKEALALSQLNHPNIETVHDFDTQDGVDFLVMEHIPGVTLSDKLAVGPLSEKEIARLGAQLAEGLTAAHAEGVVHRDLKPGNLRVTPDGRLKILDFGLAKLLRPVSATATTESLTETQAVPGTLPYMAPEQLQGEPADARTDLYAAGTVLYEMATGRRPFVQRLASALIADIVHTPPPRPRQFNPRVPSRLEDIILKCLEKEPENRYQSAKELLVDLRRLAAPTAPSPQALAWGRLWQRPIALAGVALVVLAAILFGLNVGGLRERLLGRGGPPRIESLAVLPLENLSHDPEQDYFADGMTEALITDLAQISALRIISRTSVMQYKGVKKPLPEIARELRVDAVIEGSVQRSGDRVRITAQLIDARADKHLWADSYERDLRDVLALQSDVARAIAREIRVKLTPQEQARLASTRTVNPEAHEAYLKGRFHWNKRTEEGMKKGLEYFTQAIEKDPTYAMAYTGLADSYNMLGIWGFLPPKEAYPRAKAASLKALEMDESLAEAYTALGWSEFAYDWDKVGAEREFERAIELNPGYATAHHWYALYLVAIGRREEAIAEIQRAQALDPLSPIINANVGLIYLWARQPEEAMRQLRKAIQFDPNFAPAQLFLGVAYEQKGMFRESLAEFQQAVRLSGGGTRYRAALAHSYALAGRPAEARKILLELKQLSQQTYVSPYEIAIIYAGLGERAPALAWLGKAYNERDSWLIYLNVEPRFHGLRDAPRFQDLLRRIGLAP